MCDTHREVFVRFIEENPFEKGFPQQGPVPSVRGNLSSERFLPVSPIYTSLRVSHINPEGAFYVFGISSFSDIL